MPRLDSLLNSSRELSALTSKARQLLALQIHWEQVAPPSLLRSCRILRLDAQTLTVAADSGAVAAKLRQLTDELATKLKERGCEVTGIQVQVQVNYPIAKTKEPPKIMSPSAKKQLTELSASLEESPLKTALNRLASNRLSKDAPSHQHIALKHKEHTKD